MPSVAAQPQSQPPPDQSVLIAVVLAMLAKQATADQLARVIGVRRSIVALLLAAIGVTGRYPSARRQRGLATPAMDQTMRDMRLYRAAFLVNAAKRIDTRVRSGMPAREAVNPELRYWRQHKQANEARRDAAAQVDQAARDFGPLLGWYAQPEGASPECAAAHGHNFDVNSRPVIGWPGSVHPFCRCYAGPPYATRVTVDAATQRIGRARSA